ncbi:MAG TPA: amidohydrolase family protein [Acetobacteraceae bacterium]|nr:amidohydrolase family protein [Acetobacteraceae bacterium]
MITPPHPKAPPLSCDCHFHIFGPYDRFPLDPGRRYDPPPASVEDYLAMAEPLGLQRMVVVQASVYGTDNRVTLDAVERFGRDRARAVAVIDDRVDDVALRRLDAGGVRGIRLNLVSGNGTPEHQLDALARRIASLGWHIQIYADGDRLEQLAPCLARLPVPVMIDHLGGVRAGHGIQHAQFQALLRLMDTGRAWIKLSSYRASSTGHPWDDSAANVRALAAAAPEHCVWGTDWPHPGMDPIPGTGNLLDQFLAWVPDPAARHRILVENPARLYGFTTTDQ